MTSHADTEFKRTYVIKLTRQLVHGPVGGRLRLRQLLRRAERGGARDGFGAARGMAVQVDSIKTRVESAYGFSA